MELNRESRAVELHKKGYNCAQAVACNYCDLFGLDEETVYRMINPNIVSYGPENCSMEEGCLSVLGKDGLPVYAYVSRPQSVVVEWTDESGEHKMAEMSGLPARIVQHETDHLDGKLFIDHLPSVRREMVMRKVKKLNK